MSTSPEDTLLPLLGGVVEKAPGEWVALCPCHDDHSPSLSITRTDRGGLLLYCFVCKDKEIDRAICQKLGIKLSAICPPRDPMPTTLTKPSPRGVPALYEGKSLVKTYEYHNADGSPNKLVARYESVGDSGDGKRKKTFLQYRPDGSGGWVAGVKGLPEVPYRLPELLASSVDEIVFVVEGEKCAEALVGLGLVATTNAGGGGKWPKEFAEHFYDRDVVVLPDNDKTGADHAYKVVRSLRPDCRLINTVTLPGLGESEDVFDWIARGGTRAELLRIVAENTNLRPQIPDHDEAGPVATAEAAASSRAWGELVPFDQLDLPEFPAQVLPDILRGWVRCVSVSTQTPLDLAALLGLATCSASIAKRVEVQVTPDWREPVNLYVAIELPPGNRKSSVHAEALAPLRKIERDETLAAAPVVAKAQSERRRMQARLAKLEKIAAEKGDAAAEAEADQIAEQLALTPEVVPPRRITDESTPEELARILAAQGGRIASMSAEGGVFDMLTMYGDTPNLNTLLMAHAGDDLRIDRVSRPSVHVERPALTCAYAVQPQVIEALAANKVFRGRGLCGRFAFSSPKSWLGYRDVNPPAVPDGVRQAYWAIVQQLAQIEGEHMLTLSPEAAEDRLAWQSIVETMLREGGELESIQDWGGKLVGLTIRLAGVMHAIEHGPVGAITQRTFQGAVEIGRYLIPHARHVLRRLAADDAGQAASDAEYVLRWIVRHERQAFSKRDLYQQTKNRFRKVEALGPVLAELIGRNFIRPVDVQAGGRGRPSEQYETNPAVFETPGKHPHSPQKSLGLRSGGVSGDFGDGSRETQNTNPVRSGGGL